MVGISGTPAAPIPPDPKVFSSGTDKTEKKEKTQDESKIEVEGEGEQELEIEQEVEAEESEEGQEKEDQEGGGQGGGGSDFSGGGDGESGNFQDSLTQDLTDALTGTSQARKAARTSATGTTTLEATLQGDHISSAKKASVSISVPTNAKWIASLPNLPGPGTFNLNTVSTSFKGNPWLTSSFLVTLTMNMMSIVKIQQHIKQAESKYTTQMLDLTYKIAVEIGNLVMEKAELEAEMHKAMAITAIVAFSVAVAGTALQLGGQAASSVAGGLKESLKAPGASATTPTAPAAGATPTLAPQTPGGAPPTAQGTTTGAGGTSQTQPAQLDGTAGVKPPASVPWYKTDKGIGILGGVGGGMTTVGTALGAGHGSLTGLAQSIADNFVQMYFKLEIGKKERMTEIKRGIQAMIRQALESSTKSYSDASQALEAALNNLDKIRDAVTRAHSLGRG